MSNVGAHSRSKTYEKQWERQMFRTISQWRYQNVMSSGLVCRLLFPFKVSEVKRKNFRACYNNMRYERCVERLKRAGIYTIELHKTIHTNFGWIWIQLVFFFSSWYYYPVLLKESGGGHSKYKRETEKWQFRRRNDSRFKPRWKPPL